MSCVLSVPAGDLSVTNITQSSVVHTLVSGTKEVPEWAKASGKDIQAFLRQCSKRRIILEC
jgi:hypothetical protein